MCCINCLSGFSSWRSFFTLYFGLKGGSWIWFLTNNSLNIYDILHALSRTRLLPHFLSLPLPVSLALSLFSCSLPPSVPRTCVCACIWHDKRVCLLSQGWAQHIIFRYFACLIWSLTVLLWIAIHVCVGCYAHIRVHTPMHTYRPFNLSMTHKFRNTPRSDIFSSNHQKQSKNPQNHQKKRPFNLGMTHKFCGILRDLLRSKQGKIVYYTSPSAEDTSNAMYLLG